MTVESKNGAGIGSGKLSETTLSKSVLITINGGTVTALERVSALDETIRKTHK